MLHSIVLRYLCHHLFTFSSRRFSIFSSLTLYCCVIMYYVKLYDTISCHYDLMLCCIMLCVYGLFSFILCYSIVWWRIALYGFSFV